MCDFLDTVWNGLNTAYCITREVTKLENNTTEQQHLQNNQISNFYTSAVMRS